MPDPEIIVVDQPAYSVTASESAPRVTSVVEGERVVEVETPTYDVTVTQQTTTVVVADVVVAGSGSGNSYFPSGW